jgi:protein-S-isoprenylcysteine O-methyltransferase Ste14
MESHEKYQTKEFGFSETFIRQGYRRILVCTIFLIFFIVAFALYLSNFRIEKALTAVGYTILITSIILAIEIPLINRRQRKLKVVIDEDKLIRQCGKKQQIFLWKDITRIKTVEKKNGVVVQIKIYPKKVMMATYIHGFQEMENIANLIRERTSDSALHQEKRWKLDWQNPYVGLLVGGLPTMVIMFIITSMGSKAIDIFAIVFALLVGSFALIIRPLTKLNACNKWVESVLGIILLGLGIYALIYFLLFGKMP